MAAGHPATARAAAEILRAGGNAFDAAVGAGFAAAVAEPLLTGLGGGGFLLARPVDAEPVVYDFFVDTPGLGLDELPTPPLRAGHDRVPVVPRRTSTSVVARLRCPGCWPVTWKRTGSSATCRSPTSSLRAAALAHEGIPVDPFQASVIELLWPIVSISDEGYDWYGRATTDPSG